MSYRNWKQRQPQLKRNQREQQNQESSEYTVPLAIVYVLNYRRIREKYETELKEVEKSERNTLQKFNSMKVCGATVTIAH